ncbi:MAG: DnaB-like helicase C-terminal domain-containing protein [Planctomycetota bacterium]
MTSTQTQPSPKPQASPLDAAWTALHHEAISPLDERVFLAMLLAHPSAIQQARQDVPVETLQFAGNRDVYSAILAAAAQAEAAGVPTPPLDTISLAAAVSRAGQDPVAWTTSYRDRVDNMVAIGQELTAGGGLAAKWSMTVASLREAATRIAAARACLDHAHQIVSREKTPDPGQAMQATASSLQTIAETGRPSPVVKLGSAQDPAGGGWVVPCRFTPMLNWHTGGHHPNTLGIVAARSGGGKSSWLQAVALDAAQQGMPTLIVDTEMSAPEVAHRLIANLTGINGRMVQRIEADPSMNPDTAKTIAVVRQELEALPLHHVEAAGWSSGSILSAARTFAQAHAPLAGGRCLIILDYLKLPAEDSSRSVAEWQALGYLADALKSLAGQLGISVLAGVQANRGAVGADHAGFQDEAASLLAGSDRIFHAATSVLVLRSLRQPEAEFVRTKFGTRTGPEASGAPDNDLRFNLIGYLPKCRGGATYPAGVPIHFARGLNRFEELAWQVDPKTNDFIRDQHGHPLPTPELDRVRTALRPTKKSATQIPIP